MRLKRMNRFIVALAAFNIGILFYFINTTGGDRLARQNHKAPANNKFSTNNKPIDIGSGDKPMDISLDVKPVYAEAIPDINGINKDVADLISKIVAAKMEFFPVWYWNASMKTLSRRLNAKKRKAGAAVLPFQKNKEMANTGTWAIVDSHIRQYSLYDPDDPAVDALLKDMATLPIEETRANHGGTSVKVDVKFKGGGWAVLKPMIILGYNRVPPSVGRRVNIRSELQPVFPEEFRRTVYTSDDGRDCFHRPCGPMCRRSMRGSLCGSPDVLEVALMYFIPTEIYTNATLLYFWNPWKSKRKHDTIPEWVSVEYLCKQTRHEYSKGHTLPLELLDVLYFDSLIANYDRHDYVLYDGFNNDTIPVLFDNAKALPDVHLRSLRGHQFDAEVSNLICRNVQIPGNKEAFERIGFGNPMVDPIYGSWTRKNDRCCLIKKTTLLKYLNFHLGPASLSELMRNSLKSDPVDPVLPEDELTALDRRVHKTILHIKDCLEEYSIDYVIMDDVF